MRQRLARWWRRLTQPAVEEGERGGGQEMPAAADMNGVVIAAPDRVRIGGFEPGPVGHVTATWENGRVAVAWPDGRETVHMAVNLVRLPREREPVPPPERLRDVTHAATGTGWPVTRAEKEGCE